MRGRTFLGAARPLANRRLGHCWQKAAAAAAELAGEDVVVGGRAGSPSSRLARRDLHVVRVITNLIFVVDAIFAHFRRESCIRVLIYYLHNTRGISR